MTLAGVSSLVPRPEKGTWYRAVAPRFASSALSSIHTRRVASRFSDAAPSRPGFEVLYLAESAAVAAFEVGALFGSPPHAVAGPGRFLILPVAVDVTGIADLTQPAIGPILGTTAQELTGDWRGYRQRGTSPPATIPAFSGIASPTQELGNALNASAALKGFVTFSAKVPYNRILCIFPPKLVPTVDKLRYTHAGSVYQIP